MWFPTNWQTIPGSFPNQTALDAFAFGLLNLPATTFTSTSYPRFNGTRAIVTNVSASVSTPSMLPGTESSQAAVVVAVDLSDAVPYPKVVQQAIDVQALASSDLTPPTITLQVPGSGRPAGRQQAPATCLLLTWHIMLCVSMAAKARLGWWGG